MRYLATTTHLAKNLLPGDAKYCVSTPVSTGAVKIVAPVNATRLTHPDIASLVDPLFTFGGKRVSFNFSFNPLSAKRRKGDPAKRRSGESTGRVRASDNLKHTDFHQFPTNELMNQ